MQKDLNAEQTDSPLNTRHLTLNAKSNLSPELLFLIACCQVQPDPEEIVLQMEDGRWRMEDWREIITAATRHGILPLVYKTLKNLSTTHYSLFTIHYSLEQLLADLKSAYSQIAHRNMLMTAGLLKIMKLFEEHDIQALAFKGPALAQMAYGDITFRQYGDLDILIKKQDHLLVLDLLLQEGYIPEIDLKEHTKETFFDRVNVIGMHKPSSGIYIEIHWELLSKNYAIDWEEQELWKEKTYVPINHKEIRVLPTEQLLLYLCVHGAKHLFERLEWVCDIDRTIRSSPDIDWSKIYSEAEKLGIKRMLHLGLSLAQHFFGLDLPATVQQHIDKDPKVEHLVSKIIAVNFSKSSQRGKSYNTFALLWEMRENFSNRLRFAWYALFATKFDDFKYVQLPGYLSFLYPLIRPFRLITKYFR